MEIKELKEGKYLDTFFDIKNTSEKVVMIDGKWGSGKTYLFREYVENSGLRIKHKTKYVSLYGVHDINEVNIKVNEALHGKVANWFKHIFSFTLKLGAAVSPVQSVGNTLTTIDNQIAQTGNKKRKRIIVFDDLERVDEDFSYVQLMGYINTLVGSKCKVLCICNSEKIEDKNSTKTFEEFKEKSFDKVYVITKTDAEVIKQLFKEIGHDNAEDIIIYFNDNIRDAEKVTKFIKQVEDALKKNPLENYIDFYSKTEIELASICVIQFVFSKKIDTSKKINSDILITKKERKYLKLNSEAIRDLKYFFNSKRSDRKIYNSNVIRLTIHLLSYYYNKNDEILKECFKECNSVEYKISGMSALTNAENRKLSDEYIDELGSGKLKITDEDGLNTLIVFLRYTKNHIADNIITILGTNIGNSIADYDTYDKYDKSLDLDFTLSIDNVYKNIKEIAEGITKQKEADFTISRMVVDHRNGKFDALEKSLDYINRKFKGISLIADNLKNNVYFLPDFTNDVTSEQESYCYTLCNYLSPLISYKDNLKSILESVLSNVKTTEKSKTAINYMLSRYLS